MTVRIHFASVKPKIHPSEPVNGSYTLEIEKKESLGSLLSLFGLDASGISAIRNGKQAGLEEIVKDGDEIHYILLMIGG